MPLISIIVPIYNVEKYLRCCLDSVLAQTFTDYECILVDDGSPDNCPAICDEYAVKDKRFKVTHKENGGLSDARNAGIQTAVGEYIVLLDSDDFLADREALADLAATICNIRSSVIFNSNADIVETGSRVRIDSVEKNIEQLTPRQFYKKVMSNKNNLMAGWLFSVRKDFLIRNQLFFKKGILHEDDLWMPKIICHADMIAINHGPFYAYRKGRKDSITSSVTVKNLTDKIVILRELREFINSDNCPEENRAVIKPRIAQLWCGIIMQIVSQKYDDNYQCRQLLADMNDLKQVLSDGTGIKYRLLYIFVSFFGIARVVHILASIKN
ncbi:hypothetical protein FACS1894141_5880 [Spirochaetia bacterium]|nr:hypothetical protein FACS1894141_5880 [Spirochaetia bacterium]